MIVMKKLLSAIICITMIFTGTVFALETKASQKTNVTETEFYIQRFGVQMDIDGNVTSQDTAYFTPCVYTDNLTQGSRDMSYTITYTEGAVSSDDVIAEVVNKPDDASILKFVKDTYEDKGYILSSNGKVVEWSRFDTSNYELRWYVLKLEDIWHVDGVIIEKETDEPIEIPVEGDDGYIPPEDVEDGNDTTLPEYSNNYAYIFGYDDTTMGAENNLLRCEAAAMVHRLVKQNNMLGDFHYDKSNSPVFADVTDAWFRSGIEFIEHRGGFDANPGEDVYPYTYITRGETFKIMCTGLGFTDDATLTLDDYAQIMYNSGYIEGDENGDLNVYDLITRAECCTIYNRVIDRENARLETADGTEITAETYGFTDLSEGQWYYETMLRATSAYDEDGYVDLELRGVRNNLDDY